jgi:hypothetical protein
MAETYSASREAARQSALYEVFWALLIRPLRPWRLCVSLLLGIHSYIVVGYYIACAVRLRRGRGHDIRFASVIADEMRGHSRLCV